MKLFIWMLLLMVIVSCKSTVEEKSSEVEIVQLEISPEATTLEKEVVAEKEAPEIESKYQYDKEWEVFKEAILNKDVKGVAAFASSDAVDAEALIMVMDNEILLQKLRETKYDDLTVSTTDLGASIEFHAIESIIDEEGNEIGSAITIFFTEGEQFLELDYFVAAG
jgi:hypothetical protein